MTTSPPSCQSCAHRRKVQDFEYCQIASGNMLLVDIRVARERGERCGPDARYWKESPTVSPRKG